MKNLTNYSRYRTFPTLEQANELKQLLIENGIQATLGHNIPSFDIAFSRSTVQNKYEVRIAQNDFEKAEYILKESTEQLIYEVDENHYLFKFTDSELYEVLLKSDEWSNLDYNLAQKILEQRGKPVDDKLLESLKEERLNHLSKPEKNQRYWIIIGYIGALCGGFWGMVIGYSLWAAKKTLPNGEKVYSYSQSDRKHGKYIFFIGLIMLPVILYFKIARN